MTSTNTKKDSKPVVKNKYTTQEVFDSMYWTTLDCDDQMDGNLHIVSTIDGNTITLPLIEILNSIGITLEDLKALLESKKDEEN